MVNKELHTILKSIGERAKGKELTFKKNSQVFFDILESNNNSFKEFKEEIRKEWEQFKFKNQNRIIKKTYSTFFFHFFHDYFKFYLQKFCGFDTNSLDLIIKEKISDDQLFLEYSYYISPEEQEYFKEFSEAFNNNANGIASPFGYLYLVVAILGVNLRMLLEEKFYVVLDGAILENGESDNIINFLIVIKNSHDELYNNYYHMYLYYFLKYFKDVPKTFHDKLLDGRDKVYEIALNEYSFAKDKLVDLLYFFYKKCNLLQNFSPLLDFLNFVCSRVEDSVFPKLDIIKKEFLQNFDYTNEKKNSLLRIFDTIDKKSTLYSTFQSNNLPSQQFNLFLLYTKYFFGSGSLEALEVGDLLFLPEDFKIGLNKINKKLDNVINANTIKDVQEFLDNFSIISNLENPNLFFKIIFNKDLSQINYDFFRAFLHSINTSIKRLIESENKILEENPINEPLTFKVVVDHICRMLYVLIDKIFIRKLPGQASKNFIDPRSRYIGRNIALRVLELFIFSDLNVSDDVWPDVIISLNKDTLLKDLDNYNIQIPEKHFYQYEDFDRFLITFNFLSSNNLIFEEWLISGLIIPINNFILKIRGLIKECGKKSEPYEVLRDYLIENTNDMENIQDLEFICRQISVIWENLR
ncbi:MAG: hypothetical protein HWN80_10000 [Candidatus Lokiarchaeota archaeon]|nr:hypothetical protein [Candidatus Lokiarchaeota archaeon]